MLKPYETKTVYDELVEHTSYELKSYNWIQAIESTREAHQRNDSQDTLKFLEALGQFMKSIEIKFHRKHHDVCVNIEQARVQLSRIAKELSTQSVEPEEFAKVIESADSAITSASKLGNESILEEIVLRDPETKKSSQVETYTLRDVMKQSLDAWSEEDFSKSAAKLRIAAKFIKEEIAISTSPEGKTALNSIFKKLNNFADRIEGKQVARKKSFDDIFELTHEALEINYEKPSLLSKILHFFKKDKT